MSEKKRAYFYRIAGSAATLAVAYGLVTDEKAALWVAAAAAVLGLPMAAANTSTKPADRN